MNGQVLVGLDGTTLIDGLTNDIDDTAESLGTNGHSNGSVSVSDWLATHETLSGVKSNGTHIVATQMLGDLKNETVLSAFDLKRIENGRELTVEFDINNGTDNLGNLSIGNAAKASCCTET